MDLSTQATTPTFRFEVYKEKEMVSFRRMILALAVLALFTGLASAQEFTTTAGDHSPPAIDNTAEENETASFSFAQANSTPAANRLGSTVITPLNSSLGMTALVSMVDEDTDNTVSLDTLFNLPLNRRGRPNLLSAAWLMPTLNTTLMYPWVNSEPGFDTGIAIANTSSDPFRFGGCTLNFFREPGQHQVATHSTPNIAPGTVYADQLGNIQPKFRGYIIAVCNFPSGNGYALLDKVGTTSEPLGYLALTLPAANDRKKGWPLK